MNGARALAGVGRGLLLGQGAAIEAVDDCYSARQDNTRGADAPSGPMPREGFHPSAEPAHQPLELVVRFARRLGAKPHDRTTSALPPAGTGRQRMFTPQSAEESKNSWIGDREYQRSLILTRFTPWGFRDDFCRQSGARPRRGAGHRKQRAGAAGGKNRPALAGGAHRRGRVPRGATGRRLPAIWDSGVPRDAARRGPVCASRPVGPAAPMCAHETGPYQGSLV